MTKSNFKTCLDLVLVHEGGYVNHPRDPGGATNKGVIQRTYDGYRRRKNLSPRSVREITEKEVREIYKKQYWDAVRGDDLPIGLDYAVFDFAVNSGVGRAAKYLQRILKVKRDGRIGDITLGAIPPRYGAVIIKLCEDRWAFMKRLKHWPTFGRGWTRRVMGNRIGVQSDDKGVIDRAVKMMDGAQYSQPMYPTHKENTKASGGQNILKLILDFLKGVLKNA